MAEGSRQMSSSSPSAVAIHDNGNVARVRWCFWAVRVGSVIRHVISDLSRNEGYLLVVFENAVTQMVQTVLISVSFEDRSSSISLMILSVVDCTSAVNFFCSS